MEVFERISKRIYLVLRLKCLLPSALPSMYVLVVKLDKNGKSQLSKIAHSCAPITNLPTSIKYDGHLTCSLMRNHTDPFPEPLPPGTHVTITHNNKLPCGTIQRVPVFTSTLVHSAATTAVVSSLHPSVPSTAYTLQLNEGGTTDSTFEELVQVSKSTVSTDDPAPLDPFLSLMHFL